MANKKINQLVSKTSILSTDLFGIGDATTGQLFKKTIAELQAAIGGAVISVNGLVGTVVLDTDDIQELATPTNKYFTDARARGAISLTVTGNSGASTYSSGTGVLNVPTYTLAGLGGITASFLSGASGISYNSTTGVISYSGTVYTDSSIRALLSGGTGITYNSSTGAISYSGTVYTDSSVRALISLTTTGNSGASTYNNTTGVINVPEYTLAGLGGISLTSLSGGTGITYNNTTGAISYSGTVYTDASVRALVSAGTGLSYNNTTGVFTSTITQYTDALARASISITTTGTSGASTYNSTTGVLNVPQYAAALSGTTNFHAKFTSSSTIGNSIIFDNGTNVGIGNISPSTSSVLSVGASGSLDSAYFNVGVSALVIKLTNTSNNPTIARWSNFNGNFYDIQNNPSDNSFAMDYNDTERFRINPDGRIEVKNKLSTGTGIDGTHMTFDHFSIDRNNGGGIYINLAQSGNVILCSGGGRILMGTQTDNGERLYVNGAIRATGTITANSDIILKKNLLKIENALEKVEQINGYTYELKEDDSKRHAGVIAQEIQGVLPEIVNKGNDGILGVEYGNISALLIEAIKEQNIKIKNLETLLASK